MHEVWPVLFVGYRSKVDEGLAAVRGGVLNAALASSGHVRRGAQFLFAVEDGRVLGAGEVVKARKVPNEIERLRAAVRASEAVERKAVIRLGDADRALRDRVGAVDEVEAHARVDTARVELNAARAALQEAKDRYDNAREDEQEASNDERIPQTDYRFAEIVEKLWQGLQRTTYGAVAELLNAEPGWVRRWVRGSESRKNCFIVMGSTGEPSDYPPDCIHPSLTFRPQILRTGAELLAWLNRNGVVFKR